MQRNSLSYDIVIVTKDRPEALEISIPLILAQSRKPQNFIVIDSSEDHEKVAQVVREKTSGYEGNTIIRSHHPSLTEQRNTGLTFVTSDIVFFPDDDSLLYPDVIEKIMDVYELDVGNEISGICTAEADIPPPNSLPEGTYKKSSTEISKTKLTKIKNKIDNRVTAFHPFLFLGNQLASYQKRAENIQKHTWFTEKNCTLVPYMTGFRMTFRSDAIKKEGFESLFRKYGTCEDVEACFSALKHGVLVGITDAEIYHHKFPGKRGDGFTMGMRSIVNYNYVIAKHAREPLLDEDTIKSLGRKLFLFNLSRVIRYLISVRDRYSLMRFLGALNGAFRSLKMYRQDHENLSRIYERVMS